MGATCLSIRKKKNRLDQNLLLSEPLKRPVSSSLLDAEEQIAMNKGRKKKIVVSNGGETDRRTSGNPLSIQDPKQGKKGSGGEQPTLLFIHVEILREAPVKRELFLEVQDIMGRRKDSTNEYHAQESRQDTKGPYQNCAHDGNDARRNEAEVIGVWLIISKVITAGTPCPKRSGVGTDQGLPRKCSS